MSMLLMVAAMKSKLGNPIRKLVLIKLADNANDDGICWPSYRHIADQCEIDRKTAIRHVEWLEENKFLSKQYRKDDERGNKSNVYRIDIASGTAHLGSQNTQPSGAESPPPSGTESPRTSNSFEPINEPVNYIAPSTDGACKVCGGTGVEIGFDSDSGGQIQYNCSQCTGKEPQANPDQPSPSKAGSESKSKRKTKAEKLLDKLRSSGYLIAQASDDVLTEWCKLRARKGASDSDLVHKRIDGQLQILINHGMTIDAALTEQVARNWTDLKAEWFDVMKGRLPNQQEWAQQTQPGWSAGLENEIYRGGK